MVDDDFRLDWTVDALETPLVRIRLHREISIGTRSQGSRCPIARPNPDGNDNKPIDEEVPTYGDHKSVIVTTRRKAANSSAAQKTPAKETNERKQRKHGTNDTRKNKTTTAAHISDEERLITDFERDHDKNSTINDDEALDDILDEDLDIFDMALAYQDDGGGVSIADVLVFLTKDELLGAVQR